MPMYETYEKLLEKLTQAVEETIGFQVEWTTTRFLPRRLHLSFEKRMNFDQ